MILTKTVQVNVGGAYQKYYEQKGYKIPKRQDKRGRILAKQDVKIEVSIYDLPKTSGVLVKYSCDDCGSIHEVKYATIFGRKDSQYLKTKETLCSNCANKGMSGKNNGQYKHGNNRYCEYRSNARRRKISFDLTVEQFENLTKKECHYCGCLKCNFGKTNRGNGIDRKNNNLGYTIDNCVPCCARCNFIKNSMPYEEFLQYIKKLYERILTYEI